MKPNIIKSGAIKEHWTPERCFIFENHGRSAGDSTVSVARARVEPKVTTKAHHLEGMQEIYIIAKGRGKVFVGDLEPMEVAEGDVVVIPPGVSQRIANIGETDLIFYCICTPAFTETRYHDEENKNES